MSPLAVAWVSGEGEQQILTVGTSDGSNMTSGGTYRLKTLLVHPHDGSRGQAFEDWAEAFLDAAEGRGDDYASLAEMSEVRRSNVHVRSMSRWAGRKGERQDDVG